MNSAGVDFSPVAVLRTTGLAVPQALLGDERVAAACGALTRALQAMAGDPGEIARTLVEVFRYDLASAERRAPVFAAAFGCDGTAPRVEVEAAVELLSGALGVEPRPVDALYAADALG